MRLPFKCLLCAGMPANIALLRASLCANPRHAEAVALFGLGECQPQPKQQLAVTHALPRQLSLPQHMNRQQCTVHCTLSLTAWHAGAVCSLPARMAACQLVFWFHAHLLILHIGIYVTSGKLVARYAAATISTELASTQASCPHAALCCLQHWGRARRHATL
jgi:hypothetical protein